MQVKQDLSKSEAAVGGAEPMSWDMAKPLIIDELVDKVRGVEIADHAPQVGFLGFRVAICPGKEKLHCKLENCQNLENTIPVINKLTALIKLVQENPFIADSFITYRIVGKDNALNRSTLTLKLKVAGKEKAISINLAAACGEDAAGNFVFNGQPIQKQYDLALG